MRRPQQRNPRLAQALGQKIAERRVAAGMTQAVLAEHIGVETVSISRMERGTVLPSLLTLSQIAGVLRVGVGELLGAVSLQPSDHRDQLEQLLSVLEEDERLFLLDLIRRQVAFMQRNRR